MKQNKHYSYNQKSICDGCKLCVKGRKSVIFITGLCPRSCEYCPLSDEKYKKDVMYCNERKVNKLDEIIAEVKISRSTGAGITGGDPLVKLGRTVEIIKMLKKSFGSKFHIHLYTSPNLVTEDKLNQLHKAGLDEIRFHPDIESDKLWNKINVAKTFNWKVGIEIPVIPGKYTETVKLIEYFKWVDFINLNQLEMSDGNAYVQTGKCKDTLSYAITGSKALAMRLMKRFSKLQIHFCTAKLKDRVQLANRIKLRAKSVARKLDYVDEEGLITHGEIKGTEKDMIAIKKEFSIPTSLIEFDGIINIAAWVLLDIYKEIRHKCYIVKEYPTYDKLIIEKEELK